MSRRYALGQALRRSSREARRRLERLFEQRVHAGIFPSIGEVTQQRVQHASGIALRSFARDAVGVILAARTTARRAANVAAHGKVPVVPPEAALAADTKRAAEYGKSLQGHLSKALTAAVMAWSQVGGSLAKALRNDRAISAYIKRTATTESADAFSQQLRAAAEKNGDADRWVWDAHLEGCPICVARHGRLLRDVGWPPAHPNCECIPSPPSLLRSAKPKPTPGGVGSSGVTQTSPTAPSLQYVNALDPQAMRRIYGCKVEGDVTALSQRIFGGRCPSPESWARVWRADGHTVQITSVAAKNKQLVFELQLLNKSGAVVTDSFTRAFSRHDGKLVAHNKYLFLSDGVQDAGIGRQITRSGLLSYMDMGVSSVHVEAAQIGRYAWPRFGWSWDASRNAQWKTQLRDYLVDTHKLSPERADVALAHISGYAHEIAGLRVPGLKARLTKQRHGGGVKTGPTTVGKAFLLDLRNSDYNAQQLRLDDPNDVGFQVAKKALDL